MDPGILLKNGSPSDPRREEGLVVVPAEHGKPQAGRPTVSHNAPLLAEVYPASR